VKLDQCLNNSLVAACKSKENKLKYFLL